MAKVLYTLRWDESDRKNPGWYAEFFRGEDLVEDSMKIWSVNLDDLGTKDVEEANNRCEDRCRELAGGSDSPLLA